jgi:chorismate mutase/prephenate dehydratase
MAVRVAVVGPEGGAGHAAAREQFGHGATYVVLESPEAALDAVTRERAEFAVLPYETSIDGPVQLTILALSRSDLRIGLVRETVPTLHLFSRSGSTDDIVKVYATAADRALAGRSLGELARDRGPLSVLDVKSPLVACQLAQEEAGAAALANEATGAGVGLQIARRSMLDQSHGRVRYAVVGGRPSPRTGDDSTAVVFSLHDAPGALLEVLSQFAEREINLTRIQSRPVEADGWAYLFFIEVVGHATDRGIVSAFEEVKRRTKFFKVLGSYPARA